MIDFIPLSIYTPIFNYLILFLIMLTALQAYSGNILNQDAIRTSHVWGILLTVLLIVYMGLRPVSGYYFGDTINYAASFYKLQATQTIQEFTINNEWLFSYLINWFAKNSSIHLFFLFCASVYIGTLWLATRRIFGNYYYIPLLVILSMFTFWSYGVNGIRNGMASSIIILAMSYRKNIPVMALLCFLALGIHKSLILTIAAGSLAWLMSNPERYLQIWFVSIFASAAVGNKISGLMINLGLGNDDRFQNYLTSTEFTHQFSRTGFRWDFLLYSALPVAVGYYFIFRRQYKDQFYIWLFNIYLITNSFWILVIRAEFSNRFAQLSWFIMPLVLIYPFFKKQFWIDQEQKIGMAILIFYAFTFYSNILK